MENTIGLAGQGASPGGKQPSGGTEEQLHSKCTIWFWNTYPNERRMLFHADNNSVNFIVGARKKALGVVKGVSDLVLVLRNRVVFIELKTPSGSHSEEQLDFGRKVEARGHKYKTIRSFEQFQEYVKNNICNIGK